MTRYQVMRRCGCDPLTSAVTAFFNWLFGAPPNEIRIMHMVIEFDPEEKP